MKTSLIYNKERRLKLIEGLTKYLDNPEDVNSYLDASNVRFSNTHNIKNGVVQFEDRDGNIVDTDFSYSIEELEDQHVVLPSPSNDRDQCQKLLDELTAKIDTHRLNIVVEVSGESSDVYDPHTDDNF